MADEDVEAAHAQKCLPHYQLQKTDAEAAAQVITPSEVQEQQAMPSNQH